METGQHWQDREQTSMRMLCHKYNMRMGSRNDRGVTPTVPADTGESVTAKSVTPKTGPGGPILAAKVVPPDWF